MKIRTMTNDPLRGFCALALLLIILGFYQPQGVVAQGQWGTTANGTDSYTNGNVGIGTSTPTSLQGGITGASGRVLQIQNPSGIAQVAISSGAGTGAYMGYEITNGTQTKRLFQQFYDGLANAMRFRVVNEANGVITQDNIFTLGNNGNVGVGTLTPVARFEIASSVGGFTASNYLQISGTTSDNSNYPGLSFRGGMTATEYPFILLGNAGLSLTVASGRNSASYPNRMQMIVSTNSGGTGYAGFQVFNNAAPVDLFKVMENGNVGVGAANPQSSLHVYRQTNGGLTSVIADNDGAGTNTGQAFQFRYGSTGIIGGIYHQYDGARWVLRFKAWTNTGTESERMYVEGNTGNVGIGTSSATPLSYKLDVAGQINAATGLCIGGDCRNSWSAIGGGGGSQWTTSTNSIYYSTGNVGIGTSSPAQTLSLYKPTGINYMEIASGTSGGYVGTDGTNLAFQAKGAQDVTVYNSTGTARLLTIKNGGNVGIGTASPAKTLDVAGDLNVSGTITGGIIEAKYQDVAEWVRTSQNLSAGTVVILDSEKTNQVIASGSSYDTRVAGVISDQPGVILGQGGEGKVKVATTGRVRVKVDATRSPIKIGDLLVTSGEEGVAMKSEPVNVGGVLIHRPGTIIGKALEPLASGKGEILVLLSLQ